MIATYTDALVVSDPLLEYLRRQLGDPGLYYSIPPTQITNGWEAYTFHFQLFSRNGLPEGFAGPLIFRLYSCEAGLIPLCHEFHVQEHMTRLGFPVPRPLLLEPSTDWFEGPFMVMERVPGQTLLDTMLDLPWHIWDCPTRMGKMHAHLHALPADGFPTAATPFLDRKLTEIADHIRDFDLAGLAPGLDWLYRQRPIEQVPPCILHMDFHPMNLMVDGPQIHALDWSDADVGDPHADVAATLVLIDFAPVEIRFWWQRILALPGHGMLRRRYLRAYRRCRPLDRAKLDYYMALACLRRLCRWGAWTHATPMVTGSKPSSMRYLRADRLHFLRACFFRSTGVRVLV